MSPNTSTIRRLVPQLALALSTLLLLLLHPPSIAAKHSAFECPPIGTNCSCYSPDQIELECPPAPAQAEISVHYKPNDQISIMCATETDRNGNVYQQLPAIRLGPIAQVSVQRCPTPAGGAPFAAVLAQLGLPGAAVRALKLYIGATGLVRDHFAGLPGLQRLIIQRYPLAELPADVFERLRNLTWLELRGNELPLRRDTLHDLVALHTLDLSHNKLRALVPGVFRAQRRLRTLSLWGNELSYVARAHLEGLDGLAVLELSGNRLERIEAGALDAMRNLSELHVSSNEWRELPAGLLAHTKNLSVFTLTNNRWVMERLPAGLFAGLPALRVVVVKCGLVELDGGMFAGSVGVENITLAENGLSELPVEVFGGLSGLLELNLEGNRLERLEEGMFEQLGRLVVLRLQNNRLTEITDNTLSGALSLLELHLGGNRLHTIGSLAFRTNTQLQNIQLPDNNLTFVSGTGDDRTMDYGSSTFTPLAALRTLNLRNNSITVLLADWTVSATQLQTLDLSHNRIAEFTSLHLPTSALAPVTINLTHNRIETIDFRFYDALEQRAATFDIHLSHNPLHCDCLLLRYVQLLQGTAPTSALHRPAAAGGRFLMRWHIDELRCAAPAPLLDRPVGSLHAVELTCPLESPNASGPRHCPAACHCRARPADATMIVNCSHAGLTAVPQLLKPTLYHLNRTELHVVGNNITELPLVTNGTDGTGYDYVSELHAAHNRLGELLAANVPRALRLLDVRHNRLRRLNGTVLAQLNRTAGATGALRLHLAHNPWRCDCAAGEMLQYVQNHGQRRIADVEALTCRLDGDGGDEERALQVMQRLRPADLCPTDRTLLVLGCVAVMLLGLLGGAAVAFYYKYELQIKMWLFAHDLMTWWVTEAEADGHKEFDAFVSYSHKDERFVAEELVAGLECGEWPYRLCIHERDWLVGGAITQSIADSVERSRRTLIVLTKNFLESDWGRMEFRVAHKAALHENRARVIVVVVGELSEMPLADMDAELKVYLEQNTYIRWGDPWFWKKLRYAMPHLRQQQQQQHQQQHKNQLHAVQTLKGGGDDKLDLIGQQSPPTPPPTTTPPAELANQRFAVGTGNAALNGHVNGAFIINAHAKQSDV